MASPAFTPARRGRSRGRSCRWCCCCSPCGMSSMKVMVGGAESASVMRTSGVCPGNLSCVLKVPLSSPSFWRCFLITRALRALQASWPDRSRHCTRPRGCRPMIVEDTKTGAARPRLSLRVYPARVAHASGSLRPARTPHSLHEIGLFWSPKSQNFLAARPNHGGPRSVSARGWPRTVFQIQHVFETLIGISGRMYVRTVGKPSVNCRGPNKRGGPAGRGTAHIGAVESRWVAAGPGAPAQATATMCARVALGSR